jgi:TRAP-type uncharacterized transport system fused permease subunit
MKLGAVKYLVPLFFVLDPALVMQAEAGAILQAFVSTTVGVLLIGSVLEGYVIGVGKLELKTIDGFISAAALFVGGFILGLPGSKMDLLGLAIVALSLIFILFIRLIKRQG